MSEVTIYWVGWVKYGDVSHLAAGPFFNSDDAQKVVDELNLEDRFERFTVVYSDLAVRTNYFED